MTLFRWPVRVYYEDTDASGIVYHANYIKFFERARTEMLRSKGIEQDALIQEDNIIFVVHSIAVEYLSPARFNELIEVHSTITQLKKASLIFDQHIYRGEKLLCQATVIIACLNAGNFRLKAIPPRLRAGFL
jgi:acyl-CoA thioester hydrolase